jgi:hypothetical protein
MEMLFSQLVDGLQVAMHIRALSGSRGVLGVTGLGIMETGGSAYPVWPLTRKLELSTQLEDTAQGMSTKFEKFFQDSVFSRDDYYKYLDAILTYSPSANKWDYWRVMYNSK